MRSLFRPTTLILLLGCAFLAFGYTSEDEATYPSKIYLHGSTIIRTTPGKDIRFYDLSNPATPREISTISMTDNGDVAATRTTMYADQGKDLVIFDISDLSRVRPVDTIENIFYRSPTTTSSWSDNSVDGNSFGGAQGCGADGCETGSSNTVSTDDQEWDWNSTSSDYQVYSYSNGGMTSAAPTTSASNATSSGSSSSGSTTSGGTTSEKSTREGKGGSLARFIIFAHRLYCIDNHTLVVFDITDPQNPVSLGTKDIGDLETIFYANDHLFIGGPTGVYIYDVEDNMLPEYRGEFQHVERCDPVVVDGDYAYVTLRAGSACGGTMSEMNILDVKDVTNPKLVTRYTRLNSPYGLAVQNGKAIVCDGSSGLRVLDVSNPNNVYECSRYSKIKPIDVIWQGNLLIANTQQGFYLYDATDPCNIQEFGRLF